jgi:hypothetical protein
MGGILCALLVCIVWRDICDLLRYKSLAQGAGETSCAVLMASHRDGQMI